ncbi:uncharacterized protein LAJ45_04662 [Morchella importuna]|uniref:Rhodopsin domain-containing protein n=1 Tax=Morchella conica CCBAS932 TaxID=1392247 RepID=A0A3N4KJL8_9PEZI|nr:uncharacterized protein LAJ45_04662 [Morchella importuna]KAH8151457.1 hypothetical protein LAJ45_04662 [Morchella importuna]RPB08511.1 hypothetical protein P167DRAFT_578200 [Morchella conica CCBAS932]
MATTSATAPMMSGIGGPPQGANGTVGAGDAPGKTGDMGRVPELLAVTSILTVSMIIVVVLRIYLKLQTGIKSVRLVDWMHVLAALFSVAVSVAVAISVRFGAGRHRFEITGDDTTQGLKYYWISKLLYIAATYAVKMAVFTTLLIVASSPPQQARKFLKTMLYFAMVFMTAYSVVFWVAAVIECRPARYIFDKSGTGQCIPGNLVKQFANVHASMNTAMDLFFVLLPVFMVIYGVRRSTREKIAIAGVFLLAFFSVAAATIHTLYEFGYHETNEVLYDSSNLLIWEMLEINVGLIAINLPSLSPFFKAWLQPLRSPNRSSTSASANQNPPTPTPSALLSMSHANRSDINRSESQRQIMDEHNRDVENNPYQRPTAPFVFASSSSARYSSDSKTNLSEIMVQMDFPLEEHPAFKEREKPVLRPPPQSAQQPVSGGHRRMPTPMFN